MSCCDVPPLPPYPKPKPKRDPKFGKPNGKYPGRVYEGEPDAWVDQHGNEWWPENISHGHLLNLINWMRRKGERARGQRIVALYRLKQDGDDVAGEQLIKEMGTSYAEFPNIIFPVYPRLMNEAKKRDMVRYLDEERQ